MRISCPASTPTSNLKAAACDCSPAIPSHPSATPVASAATASSDGWLNSCRRDPRLSPWNAPLSDFAQRLNLRGTSCSYCHGGTFPTWAGPFGLTLDHILVSPEFRLKDFQRGPDIGSDHLPISAELEW